MLKKLVILVATAYVMCFCSLLNAEPWFTGPILAPSAQTLPLGHANVITYGFLTARSSDFDDRGKPNRTPHFESRQINPLLTYGLSDWVDTQLSLPYTINHSEDRTSQHISDTSILLGFQMYRQPPHTWIPSLRISLQEIFPTGRFDSLNPTDKGTGVTGAGSYQNIINFNLEDLSQFNSINYLRSRISLSYLHGQPYQRRKIRELQDIATRQEKIIPGDLYSADIAGELTVTQHWVAVMEAYVFYHTSATMPGNVSISENGHLAGTTTSSFYEISLAPAIEYNFNANYGIIFGNWFAVKGRNAPVFSSWVMGFNVYW